MTSRHTNANPAPAIPQRKAESRRARGGVQYASVVVCLLVLVGWAGHVPARFLRSCVSLS